MSFWERLKGWLAQRTPICIGCDKIAPHGINPERFSDGEER